MWDSLDWITCIGAVEKLGRILTMLVFRLCIVLLIIVFRLSLLFLIRKLQLVFGQGLLPLFDIRRDRLCILTCICIWSIISRLLLLINRISDHSSYAIFQIRWAVMLLRILQLLFSHGMCRWRSCIGNLSDSIALNLLFCHCPTHTRLRSNLGFFPWVCWSFSDLRVIVTFRFHLDVFVFLLPCRKNGSATFAVHS